MSIYIAAPGVVSRYANGALSLQDSELSGDFSQPWFDPKIQLAGRKSRYLSRATRYLLAASRQTMQEVEPWFQNVPEEKKGVIIGTNFADYVVREECDRLLMQEGSNALSSVQAPNISVNMAAAQTAIDYRCGGVCTTLTSTMTAGIEALLYAKNALDAGQVDALLVGSTEDNGSDGTATAVLPQVLGGSCTFAAWSDRLHNTQYGVADMASYELVGSHWRRYPAAALQDATRQKIMRKAFGDAIRRMLDAQTPIQGAYPSAANAWPNASPNTSSNTSIQASKISVFWACEESTHLTLKGWLYETLDRARIDFDSLALPGLSPFLSLSYSGCNTQMMLLQFALLTSSRPLLFVAPNAIGSVVVLYLKPRF